MFAILLLNASIIGAATVTLASSYALGDVSGLRQSLNARVRDAKGFFGLIAGLIAVAGAHRARDGSAGPGHHHARRAGRLRDPAAR